MPSAKYGDAAKSARAFEEDRRRYRRSGRRNRPGSAGIEKHGPMVPRSRRLPLGVKRARRRIAYGFAGTCIEARTPLCAAHSKVPLLTRYLRALAFFTENDHCHCIRKREWERVRLARARLLARERTGTLERLEMAA